MNTPPQVVTLALDAAAEAFFNALRSNHFPPERNYLAAHLTLFHHLPAQEQQIAQTLECMSAQQPIFDLNVTGIVSIGRGVAYKIESLVLQQMHQQMQQQWQPWLTPQDRQKLWPHITVQNKVAPHTAHALHQQLLASFHAFTVQGTGFRLWNYLEGPWALVQVFPFSNPVP
jgi:hypothetical protein